MGNKVHETTQSRKSWRDVIQVHPAAEMFPRISREEIVALGADILKNGLINKISLTQMPGGTGYCVLDGISRLDALEANGVPLVYDGELTEVITLPEDGRKVPIFNRVNCDDPYEYVFSVNILRRHLTPEQRHDLIAKLIKAAPEKSNRQIGEMAKAHHSTVGAVREEMESTGALSQLEKTVGADGRSRTTKPKKKPKSTATEPPTRDPPNFPELPPDLKREKETDEPVIAEPQDGQNASTRSPTPADASIAIHDAPGDDEADRPAWATTLNKHVVAADMVRALKAVLGVGSAREIWAGIEAAPNFDEIKLLFERVHALVVDLHSRYSGSVP